MTQEAGPADNLEVELKYAVSDLIRVRERLEALGAKSCPLVCETDVYYAAPDRPFEQTDEALRLRRTSERLWITYKGPRCDPQSKTRREVEVELRSPAMFDQACALLEHLGYRAIASLYKERTYFHLHWEGYEVKVSLDQVPSVGMFVELETQVSATKLDKAREALERLAEYLGLDQPERRSYLEMYWDRLYPPPSLDDFEFLH
ncbi:MAG: class IV adenylate cyclase [Gemmatales bacterium]|nr:class IV adenylate cyclase [Gemmatales bacterium]MDW7993701.1 class IV adenylate cyclase [Gemmatales bacterium]